MMAVAKTAEMTFPDLAGKVVVVSGGGHGIGAAICRLFGKQGSKVVVNDIDVSRANEVVSEITSAGGIACAAAGDVSDAAQVASIFEKAAPFGPVGVLVNNAGLIGPMKHFFDADEAWWRRILDVNLTGQFLMSQHACRIMAKNGGGAVINMSSGGASRAHRQFTAYDASKGGIEAFTRALCLDMGPYNIRVNAVAPGSIDTSAGGFDLESAKLRGANIPSQRVGSADEIASPVVFLASSASSYMNGSVLTVDGGMISQQRSATVDICPPEKFPAASSVTEL
jgi:3-oxoacyl-[acyl-carrier protein] reductase